MADMMFQFKYPGPTAPSIEQVQQEWRLTPGDLNTAYGVVLVDPRDGSYVVMVSPNGAARLMRELEARGPLDPAIGLFGNPPQEPQR